MGQVHQRLYGDNMPKIKFLDLGMQPIANRFLSSSDQIENEYKFHLTVTFDEETKLVSLCDFVSPELMFNDSYVYYSSLSKTMRSHFNDIALKIDYKFLPKNILEIGSNDGVFLKNFGTERAISVEPCGNFAKMTRNLGYTTYCEFWTKDLAEKIISNHGKQDLIFSANCMCHIQNLEEAFDLISKTLSDRGVFIFEDPSLLKMMERRSYDQIYDEHAHIFSIISLSRILSNYNLEIFNVENLGVHGGSNRVYVCHSGARNIDCSVKENLDRENIFGLNNINAYIRFSEDVARSKIQLLDFLSEFKRNGYKIVSYGATSKSATVFNYCGIDKNLIDYIVDTTKDKQGKLSPGVHIPVVSPEDGFDNSVDYAFLGAWNYEEEIKKKESKFLKSGRFISHVPYVRIIK